MHRIKLNIKKEDFRKKLNIKDGVDGKTPTKKELIDIIKPLIKEPKKEIVVEKTEVIKEITNPTTGEEIVNKINDLEITPDRQIDLKHIGGLDEFIYKNYPKIIPQKGGGLEIVEHDTTLTGDGTLSNPLSVPYSFETISKNLKAYSATISKTAGLTDTIVYDLGGGLLITKTYNRTGTLIDSIVLSGDTPSGISLTKTFTRDGNDIITNITYS